MTTEPPPYQTLRSRALCRIGLHAWEFYGPFKINDEWRSMWARCPCGTSLYLDPNGDRQGKRPRLILGRGLNQ